MNNARRKQINAIVAKLQELNEEIENILGEEQDAFDSMPEGLQSSERGDMAQEAISQLESASLDDIISSLESAAE